LRLPDIAGLQLHRMLVEHSCKMPFLIISGPVSIALNLILDGQLTKQIARQLDLSVKTVESYRSHIAKKLGVDSAIQLVILVTAFRAGEILPS